MASNKTQKPTGKLSKSNIGLSLSRVRKQASNIVERLDSKKNRKVIRLLTAFIALMGILYLGRSLIFAAWVGNRPIYRSTVIKLLENQGGSQVLDSLVNENIIFYEAQKKGVKINEEQIDKEVEIIREQLSANGLDLETALDLQGQDMDSLRKNLKMKLCLEEVLRDKINIEENEILDYYNDNKSTYFEDKKIEDVKSEIEGILYEEKLSAEYQRWLTETKENTKIIYFKNYK